MTRVKTPSPPPPGGGGDEEFERDDLYTPDTIRTVGSNGTPKRGRKRSGTAYSASPSAKRASTAASASARASATSRAATASKKKKAAPVNPQSKPTVKGKFIFGIDLGTTFTGVSYAYSGDANKIEVLMSWDDSNDDYVKIPTVIKFGDPEDIWGVEAKDLPDALRWFKLLLANPSDLNVGVRNSIQIQNARRALSALDMTPEQAIGAYLKHVWDRCNEKLKEAEGEETVDTSRFYVYITVPAIWSHFARNRMEQAVKLAGILKKRPAGQTNFELVSEPEAAALATLSGIQGRHNIKEGDIFVVVDCGGGTVDIITYRIKSMDPMILEEVVKGKGWLCGAIFVDERFKEVLIKKLEAIREDAMDVVSEAEIQEIMTRNWESEIRSQFNGQAKTWTIRQPFSLIDRDQLDRNSGYPRFTITSAEVEEVFKSSVERIHSLVDRQIEAAINKHPNTPPKYVILVGGFGSCKYLREYLNGRCQGVEILQGRGSAPWSAISRGAVIHGLTKLKIDTPFNVSVGSRIARASYGVKCEERYDEKVHSPEDKRFDPVLREDVVPGVMKWHVVKGQDIYADRHPSFPFTKLLSERPEKIETSIFRSLAAEPPVRKDNSVDEVFKLTWDIQLDWGSLDRLEQNKDYRKLEYTVEMKCSAGATTFSIYHDGYKQAVKNVSLEVLETVDI